MHNFIAVLQCKEVLLIKLITHCQTLLFMRRYVVCMIEINYLLENKSIYHFDTQKTTTLNTCTRMYILQ